MKNFWVDWHKSFSAFGLIPGEAFCVQASATNINSDRHAYVLEGEQFAATFSVWEYTCIAVWLPNKELGTLAIEKSQSRLAGKKVDKLSSSLIKKQSKIAFQNVCISLRNAP